MKDIQEVYFYKIIFQHMLSFFNRCAFTQQEKKIKSSKPKRVFYFVFIIFKLLPYLKAID